MPKLPVKAMSMRRWLGLSLFMSVFLLGTKLQPGGLCLSVCHARTLLHYKYLQLICKAQTDAAQCSYIPIAECDQRVIPGITPSQLGILLINLIHIKTIQLKLTTDLIQ